MSRIFGPLRQNGYVVPEVRTHLLKGRVATSFHS